MGNRVAAKLCCALVALLVIAPASGEGGPLRVAVASNFADALERLLERRSPGFPVSASRGSTGRLYAQIARGAPFDVFLAADMARPQALVDEGLVDAGVRPYALGILSVWSPTAAAGAPSCRSALAGDGRLAMANPRVAPYGVAARQLLESLALWPLRTPPALGENVAQAVTFTATGNARVGIVASSLIPAGAHGCRWDVEAEWHEPIVQGALVLNAKDVRADRFVDYLRSQATQTHLVELGYRAL